MNKKFLLVAGVLSIVSSNVMGAVTTDVVRGKNIYVAKTTDASGNNEFKVGLNNNLYDLGTATFHSDESGAFTGGNSYITGDKMSISNLSNEDTIYITPRRVTITKLESGLPKESTDLSSSEFHIQKFDDNWHHHRTIVDHTGIRSTNNDTGNSVWFSTVEINAGEQQIHGVTAGTEDTDAVNVKQLKDYVAANGSVDTNTITTVTNGDNATVTGTTDASGNKEFKVAVNKDLTDMNSARFVSGDNETKVDGTEITFKSDKDQVHTEVQAGAIGVSTEKNRTVIYEDGVIIGNAAETELSTSDSSGLSVTNADGKKVEFKLNNVSVGDNQIHDVATGVADTDAVNVKQLKEYMSTNNKDTKINNMINNTRQEARRGIASASALAALHPLDYNPDHKVDVMGGVGHYRGKTAVALGAAYRPNENLMFTVGTAINGKDSSVNAGVSYKVGANDSTYKSQASLAKDVEDLKQMVIKLQAELEEARKK